MSSTPQPALKRFNVWQQNLNKSWVAQEDLINSSIHKDYDILALQEPHIDAFGNTKATRNWRVLYPTSHLSDPTPPWAVMLVSSNLNTNEWVDALTTTTGRVDILFLSFFPYLPLLPLLLLLLLPPQSSLNHQN